MIYQYRYEKVIYGTPAPKRIQCGCGWWNNKPSKAKENVACCRKCGVLIDDKERFKDNFKNILRSKYEKA